MTQTQAQTTDLQSIENTINHYFEGMISHNAKSIEKAFHPTAIMKWNEKGEYMEVNAVQALSEYLNLNEPIKTCLLYTSPSPRDKRQSRMPSSA